MKKFNDVGYIIYRDDGEPFSGTDSGHVHLAIVKFDEEDSYRNGTELCNIAWQTSRDFDHWYAPSLKISTRGAGAEDWTTLDRAHKIVGFILKHFGYNVDLEIINKFPDSDAISEAKWEIKRGKVHYEYDPYWDALTPEVLVHIGLPSLNIRRVIRDGRDDNGVVLVSERLDDSFELWEANPAQRWLGDTVAATVKDAKAQLFELVTQESGRITAGMPTDIAFPREKDAYLAAAQAWLGGGMPVRVKSTGHPTPSDLRILTDVRARWHNKIQY
jgi:hypothetical protein